MTYLLLPALSSVQIIIDPVSTDHDHPATAHSISAHSKQCDGCHALIDTPPALHDSIHSLEHCF